MARCSLAKKTGNPLTNFMAPGEPNSQVDYGTDLPDQPTGQDAPRIAVGK